MEAYKQTNSNVRRGYVIFETEAAANYILKIRFFKFRNTLIEAKTALLGEVTNKKNSALGLNKKIQKDFCNIKKYKTLFSHENKTTQTASTSAELLHGYTFDSSDEPILTGPANPALNPLPSLSTCQPPTSFNMQPEFCLKALQQPNTLFPTAVPHQLNTEYLSQLFLNKKEKSKLPFSI
ncbi:hypothetical protein ACTXT7_006951 [Hymenolepis weldensis]